VAVEGGKLGGGGMLLPALSLEKNVAFWRWGMEWRLGYVICNVLCWRRFWERVID